MLRAFLRHPTTSNFLRRSRTVSTKTSSTDPVEQNLRRDLAIAHRLIAHHGMDELHWNHISARDQSWGKGKYLVTPGDKHFACIEPSDLVLMGSTTGKQLENVTADVIHGAVYQGRPDILAIVHVHTDAGMYVSCLPGDDPLTFYSQDGGGLYGKIGIHDFEGVATDHGESERIIQDLTTKTKAGNLPDVLLMRQHGTTCCGPSVGAAFVKNFYMDRCCKLMMNLNQGGINAAPITDEVLAKMGEQFELDFIKHGCEWPAMVEYAEKYLGCGSF